MTLVILKILNREAVIEKAREFKVKFVRLQFTDVFGSFKNIAVTVEELERALAGKIIFDSSVVEGLIKNKETDIYLLPDPSTFVIFPWRPREGAVARLICDIYAPDGTPFQGCPRMALKSILELIQSLGYQMLISTGIEFFLFHVDNQGKPTMVTHDQAGFCDLTPVDLGENARRDMVLTLEEMGFEISSSYHEKAPGQHEIFLKKEDNVLAMADKIATFKFVVRTIAQRHGLHASFMPRPFSRVNGSAMYLYQSLYKDGKNAFFDPEGKLQLSEVAYHYMGGLLAHARGITAITNQLVNSYKRLLFDERSPVLIAWSEQNRNTIVRIPAQRGEETCLILRNPDPAANPYLVLTAVIAAGLSGIKLKITPPLPVEENCLEPVQFQQFLKLNSLPRNLGEALKELTKDEVIKRAIGEYIYQRFVEVKEAEWERFQTEVHPWEVNEYLASF